MASRAEGQTYHLYINSPADIATKSYTNFRKLFGVVELPIKLNDKAEYQLLKVNKTKQPIQVPASGVSYFHKAKKESRNAYNKWTDEEDERLRKDYLSGAFTRKELADRYDRQIGGISSRLKKLGLI